MLTPIFEAILHDLLYELTLDVYKTKQPIAYLLGGQPGAGKSVLTQKIKHRLKEDYIVINRDNFRSLTPGFDPTTCKDSNDYLNQTDLFSAKLTEELITRLSDLGYNLIIEGTLRQVATPIKTASKLKQKGYLVYLEVIATNQYRSYFSTLKRYIQQQKQQLIARKTPKEIHDEACVSIPANLSLLQQTGLMDRIRMINRNLEVLYDSTTSKQDVDIETCMQKQLEGMDEKDLASLLCECQQLQYATSDLDVQKQLNSFMLCLENLEYQQEVDLEQEAFTR